ncbi:MAG TPA: FAD-binding oxidoreductase [Solirubrobacteraceae bacterium]|jgi:glycolate oxidase FAD binding subunit|nr:FAD-binding oxidoreductase [Solirubrobacteraceae bacterium]
MATASTLAPSTFEDAAAALAGATQEGQTVRIVGAGTKLSWGSSDVAADLELHTAALDQVVSHDAGDLTATLQAGVPLELAQRTFAAAGQMLALDPPLGGVGGLGGAEYPPADTAPAGPTIGGVVATADSGPLRHRYGAPRDLVIGATVALSDGTIAQAGGKVIKNVAGYDLAKLFSGAFGTLGLILSVNVRLHPLHETSVTALGAASDAAVLSAAAVALSRAPLEFEALDVAWKAGRGGLLARCAGREATRRAHRAARLMRDAGLTEVDVTDEDGPLWERQRAGQRSPEQALVRVAATPTDLGAVIGAAGACDGTLVGRAALGASFIEVVPDAVSRLRAALPQAARAVLLDAPAPLRTGAEAWGAQPGPELELMRRVKARFDPAHTCNPGLFVGGI